MTADGTFDQAPSDTRVAIMQATYRALCKHGYANLTTQAIADEFDKTKAVLHYHYDTKEDLLVAFFDYLLDRFLADIEIDAIDNPEEQLLALVDALLFGKENVSPSSHWEYHTAFLEVRTQAAHNGIYRAQLTRNYRSIHQILTSIIRNGIDRGVFRDVDPEPMATHLLATINGARMLHITLDIDTIPTNVRDFLSEEIVAQLYIPEDERMPE